MHDNSLIGQHFAIGFAVYGISKKEIRTRSSPVVLSPTRVMEYFRKNLTEEGRMDAMIERARARSQKISERFPLAGLKEVTEDWQNYMKFYLRDYKWKIQHFNQSKKKHPTQGPPLYVSIGKITQRFIHDWNVLMNGMDGKWLCLYGQVIFEDVALKNLSHLIEVMEQGLEQKLLKNYKTPSKYQKAKIFWSNVVDNLKLYQEGLANKTLARTPLFETPDFSPLKPDEYN